MCISIVLCIKYKDREQGIQDKITNIISEYGYGCGNGIDSLDSKVGQILKPKMVEYEFYEIHDTEEVHCACDIDHDIRVKAKLGERSQFFNMISDILELPFVKEVSIFFAYNDFDEDQPLREDAGGFGQFCERLNNWYTWQEEGYDPKRNRYYIADSSPYIYTFVHSFTH